MKAVVFPVQRWWWIIPLLAVAGIAGYAWCKCSKGAGGGSNSAVEGSVDGEKDAGASLTNRAAPTSSASASKTDVTGQTTRSKDPPAASAPSIGSHQHDDPHLDPRHVRHVNISESFLSAANAFQTEE